MAAITGLVESFQKRVRAKRARLWREMFPLGPSDKLLDLGSSDGRETAALGLDAQVTIADIDTGALARGADKYGFTPVVLTETGPLPFADGEFDVVYCSSVIEHVTVPKADVWRIRSGREFAGLAFEQQHAFASEIRRVGKGYFVQTPALGFPIESHSWLPFLGWLPRPAQMAVIRFANRFWVKKTIPDFHLLSEAKMRQLFPDAEIFHERVAGLTKSFMAVRR
ncbi:MAG: methyltransferase domain-containing protein [Acidimicrobiales bacterium]